MKRLILVLAFVLGISLTFASCDNNNATAIITTPAADNLDNESVVTTPLPATARPSPSPSPVSTLPPQTSIPISTIPAQSTYTQKPASLFADSTIAFSNDAGEYYVMKGDGTNLLWLAQSDLRSSLSISANGKRIAYAFDYSRLAIISTDGSEQLKPDTLGNVIEAPALSPDGEWVAYMADLEGRHGVNVQWRDFDIVISRIDGSARFILVQNKHTNEFPNWSPDGTEIAYITHSFVGENLMTDVNIITIGNRQEREVGNFQAGWVSGMSWSPDGKYLAIATEKGIFFYFSNGNGLAQSIGTNNPINYPAWMPDNRHLVFDEFVCDPHCNHVLKVADFVTGKTVRVESKAFRTLNANQARVAVWSIPNAHTFIQHLDCTNGWTRLSVGGKAIVLPGDPNRVRSEPSKSAEVIGQLYPGTTFLVIEGPVCADGLVFWRVENSTIPGGSGWTAEGDGKEYWLEPYE